MVLWNRLSPLERARKQGECWLCGPPASARHRLWDAVDDALRIDRMSVRAVADNWGLPPSEVRWVGQEFARARRQHRPLPGRKVFA